MSKSPIVAAARRHGVAVVVGVVLGVALGVLVVGQLEATPAGVAAGASVVSATAASLGVIAAGVAATSGVRTLRQNRLASKATSRPMVAAELRRVEHAKAYQALVVQNFGPSIARNVQVSFDPEIPDPADAAQSIIPYLKRQYASPIAVMTPGTQLENLYYTGRNGTFVDAEPTPEKVTVSVSYENDAGDTYGDRFPLDVQLLLNHTSVGNSSAPDQQLKKLVTAAESIKDSAGRVSRSTAEISGTATELARTHATRSAPRPGSRRRRRTTVAGRPAQGDHPPSP